MTPFPKTALTETRRELPDPVVRVVLKVGSAVIAAGGRLRPKAISDLAYDVTILCHRGYEVVMVVSGAVAAGYAALDMKTPPDAVVERQAAASVGQYRLMTMLARAFQKHRIHVAQLLMMQDDIEDHRRFLSARHTIQTLVEHGVVPIINENDPLADDEVKIGDNDHLAAMVTSLVSADLLVMLSSVAGVYRNGDPAEVIPRVELGRSLEKHINAGISASGVGGMAAKVSAARLASTWGVPAIIADGTRPGLLPRLLEGDEIGTLFMPREGTICPRERWIAVRTRSRGAIRVDDATEAAICDGGAGLGPSGIVEVEGRFPMGSRVDIQDQAGETFALGLASYPADEIRRMQGHSRDEFRQVLGYEYVDAVVERADMVLLHPGS